MEKHWKKALTSFLCAAILFIGMGPATSCFAAGCPLATSTPKYTKTKTGDLPTAYMVGDRFMSSDGAKIKLYNAWDKSWESYTLDPADVKIDNGTLTSKFRFAEPGLKRVVLAPRGYDVTHAYYVRVSAKLEQDFDEIKSCELTREATTLTYQVGEGFLADEITVRCYYQDGSSQDLTGNELCFDVDKVNVRDGYKWQEAGKKKVVVAVGDFTATFDLTVKPMATKKSVKSCELLTEPKTLSYKVGDRFRAEEVSLRVTYTDGKTEDITHEQLDFKVDNVQLHSKYKFVQAGKKTVVVNWGDYRHKFTIKVS